LSYSRAFGDESTSSAQNPKHTYASNGTYVATCTVTDNDGDTGSGSATVKVSPADIPITDVSVTATPTNGVAPLSVSFTCTALGGNAPLSYSWSFGDGGSSAVQNPTHIYASNGTYVATCTVTDADSDHGADSATIQVSPATIDHLITKVTVTATPTSGTAPLSVSFTCAATGGDAPLSYQWSFGDGFQSWTQNPTHVFTSADTYVATCTVTDVDGDTGSGSATITASALPPINHPPVFQPVADESVLEKHSYTRTLQVSDPDGDSVSCFSPMNSPLPSWLTLNPATCTLSGVAPAVDADQTLLIKVSARDTHGATATVSYHLTVVDVPVVPPLVFDEFGCNPDVVQGKIQYCSVRVTDGTNPVSGVLVIFTYVDPAPVDGDAFGTCVTNTKGYCSTTAVVNYVPGLYTLEATGSKAGFIAPVPVRDTFRVWKERYSIVGLETFSDDGFSDIEDTFYRGEDLYVSFAVRDQTSGQYVCDSSIVRQAFLRVQNKDPLQLTAVTDASWLARVEGSIRAWMSNLLGGSVSCTYQYWLPAIPLSDDYLGEGMVFAFSFNFQDDTAGQASKDVTVLNNPLSFDPASPVFITKRTIGSYGSTTLDLSAYTTDLETPDSEIAYTISVGPVNGGSIIVDELGPGRYRLTAPPGVTDGTTTMTLTADDTDGSVVMKTVTLVVVISNGAAPIADLGSDRAASVDTAVRFDGSASYDPDGGEIVSYAWTFGDGTTLVTSVPFATKSYADVGVYTVTLTVTDDEGMTGTASVLVTVSIVPFIPECSDGKDNDHDGLVDMDDPGCEHPGGADEGHHLRGTGVEHGLDVLDVTFDAYGDEVIVTVVVENEISDRLEDLRVTVEIPELGVKQKGPMFDIKSHRKATSKVVVFLPSGTPAGSYDVEVSISNDDLRRTVQRELVLE
jgi:PKD repeat protein